MKKKNSRTAQKPDHYPVIVISDTHLGMGNASTDLLVEFLHNTTCDRLILNGDIIDGWRINLHKERDFPEAQKRVMDAINRKIAEGVDVVYIPGNHDGELRNRDLFGKKTLGMRFEKDLEITDPKGRKLFICHGDRFDPAQGDHSLQKPKGDAATGKKKKPGLKKQLKKAANRATILLVDQGYDAGARVSTFVDKVSERVLHRSIGLFSRLRNLGEGLMGSKSGLEGAAIKHAKEKNYDGIICGHFHISAKREDGGKLYLNSGDWVESYTALAMDKNGDWKVVKWTKERQEKGLKRTFKQAANDNPDKAFRPMTEKCLDAIKSVWPGKKPKGPRA